MAKAIHGLSHTVLKLVFDTMDKLTESPPPDEHDIYIYAPGAMPSIDVPIPIDDDVRRTFIKRWGQPVDEDRVRAYLTKVWQADADMHAQGDGSRKVLDGDESVRVR
ncbi:hypothetical protein BEL07_27955 [Mycolicibacterium grossiae]|uniref:Uncharacterized protein n=2 Tax=Mycolicibacterium grossiae TaxID=1552759 RepID=A0A1E8PW02_9MYCO|nr:hypothetical protein BEL07_27955 [Mycolicibacterium grossiae]